MKVMTFDLLLFCKRRIVCMLQIEYSTIFKGPSVQDYPRKYYINDFQIGITDVAFTQTRERQSKCLATLV